MKRAQVTKPIVLEAIIREKCPNCGEGQVFEKSKGLLKMPVMHETCSSCSYKFDREPGYFLGAMYVSYGIAVAIGIGTFLLMQLFAPNVPTIYIPITIILVVIAVAKKNFKLSRIIYMHLFPW